MANATTRYGLRPHQDKYHIIKCRCAASQTIERWDPIVLDAAGTVSIGSAASTALLGSAVFAKTTGASVTAADTLDVYAADHGCEYTMQASGSLTYALNGDYVDIEGSTGTFQLNEDASAVKIMQILRPYTDDGDEEGTNCQAVVKVVAGKSQFIDIETS